ncbi:hypothetical protein Tco_1287656, partial [Tanacetum coccineum]
MKESTPSPHLERVSAVGAGTCGAGWAVEPVEHGLAVGTSIGPV